MIIEHLTADVSGGSPAAAARLGNGSEVSLLLLLNDQLPVWSLWGPFSAELETRPGQRLLGCAELPVQPKPQPGASSAPAWRGGL